MRELTVNEWFEEIDRGLKYRQQYGLEDQWSSLEALFYNVHDSQLNAGPNIVMSTGDALMSALSVPQPYITVKGRKQIYLASSRVLESIDNVLVEDLDIPSEVDRAVLNAFLYGRGIIKVGYDSEWGWDRDFDLGGKKNQLGLTLTQFDRRHQAIEFGKARAGMPWVSSCMPHDIVVPWGVFDFFNTPWVAHRVLRHIDDVKADPKYNARGLQPVMSVSDFVDSYKSVAKPYRVGGNATDRFNSAESLDVQYVELWEIHDRRTGKVLVIATGHDKFLREDQDLLQIDGNLPFVDIGFVPRSRNFWVTPDAYYLLQIQTELSDISVTSTKHRRSRILKFLFGEGAIEEDELDKLFSADVGVGVQVRGAQNPNEVVATLNPQADLGLFQEAQFTRRNAREMIGLSANQVGEFDPGSRRTATEAGIVNQASTLRMDRRQGQLARLYKGIFRIINPILWENWNMHRIVEIESGDGQTAWVPVQGKDLRGEYRYSVGFSTGGGNETLQARRQQALQFYMLGRQDPTMDPIQLARYLNSAFNDPEFSSIFKPGVLDGSGRIAGPSAGSSQAPAGGDSGQVQGGGGLPAPGISGTVSTNAI